MQASWNFASDCMISRMFILIAMLTLTFKCISDFNFTDFNAHTQAEIDMQYKAEQNRK